MELQGPGLGLAWPLPYSKGSVPTVPLLIQVPTIVPGKAEDSLNAGTSAIHVGDFHD